MRSAVVIGVVWGVFCVVANGWPFASTLAQMAVPWIWVAALAAYRNARTLSQGAVLGGVALLAANFAYFGTGFIALSFSELPIVGGVRFFALWAAVGLVIGPIAGVIGWRLATESKAFVAVVVLAIVSMAEPLALWAHIDHLDAHVAYVVVAMAGFIFPLFWFRRAQREAVNAIALALALTFPAAVVLEAVLIGFDQISAPMRLV